MSCSAYTLDN